MKRTEKHASKRRRFGHLRATEPMPTDMRDELNAIADHREWDARAA